jgi:3-dehydroquinate dehydratase
LRSNEYLYGEGVEVPPIPKDVIEARLDVLNKHLKKLLEVNQLKRDGSRCNAVIKAIKFWTDINLKET